MSSCRWPPLNGVPASEVYRPVIQLARAGAQTGSLLYDRINDMPLLCRRSMCGVFTCVLPYADMTSQVCWSVLMNRMLGRSLMLHLLRLQRSGMWLMR